MKKMIAFLLAVLLALTVFAGCSTEPNGETGSKKSGKIHVGIAAPDVTHGWVAGVAYYAEKYCKENNIDYKITTSSDAAEMMTNLNDLVTWGADVIVTWPQWSGMEEAVQEILDQGIPVVDFDVEINCEGIHKVTGNNYDMGYRSAKYIVEKVGVAASIAVMDVPSAGSVSKLRKEGFYAYLDEIKYDKSNIFEVSETGFSRDAGCKDMADILESHAKLDAVFSLDDETSIGAIQAITEAGRTDIKAITGGGGMQEYFRMIADEKYASLGLSSALYSPSMVIDAIKTAIDLHNGKTCEAVIVIPTTVVTADNVENYLDPNNTVY